MASIKSAYTSKKTGKTCYRMTVYIPQELLEKISSKSKECISINQSIVNILSHIV